MSADTSSAPRLEGFEVVGVIGGGGFSDVYLYQQDIPRRRVAVKVLKANVSDVASLANEANLMAAIEHQFIVPVYAAPVSDDGHLCLVMKYFPSADYGERLKKRPFSVAETLQIGVHLAGAIEAAHRVGVLHRDIKPSNILSDGRRPALTDFGISAVVGDGESIGYSPPWAPPEAFLDGVLDQRSDVYSLAATLYTLLEGRAPFHQLGGDNTFEALQSRVLNDDVPPLTVGEVPASLERVLRLAMAKELDHRPPTAADFGRQLQRIESELRLAPTQLDFGTPVGDDSLGVSTDASPTRSERSDDGDATGHTMIPTRLPGDDDRQRDSSAGTRRGVLIALGAVVAVLGTVALIAAVTGGDDDEQPDTDEQVVEANDQFSVDVALPPDPPDDLVAVELGDGSIEFSWSPVPEAASYYVTPEGEDGTDVEGTSYVTTVRCIQVETIGENSQFSEPTEGCL